MPLTFFIRSIVYAQNYLLRQCTSVPFPCFSAHQPPLQHETATRTTRQMDEGRFEGQNHQVPIPCKPLFGVS